MTIHLLHESVHYNGFHIIPTQSDHDIKSHVMHSYGFKLLDSDLNVITPDENQFFRSLDKAIAVAERYTDYFIAAHEASS